MHPALSAKQCSDAVVICDRHRDVDIVVRPCHGAGVEIHRPAAEEPVVDALLREQLVDARERSELSY
jgi:hypothetical protein